MNQIIILRILVILVWIGVGIVLIFTIVYPPVDDKTDQEDFVRTITGLECHQMERYILDMEYQWDKVIQYHSFKCVDFLEENLDENTKDDGDIVVGDYDGDGNRNVDDEDGNGDVDGIDDDVERNDVAGRANLLFE